MDVTEEVSRVLLAATVDQDDRLSSLILGENISIDEIQPVCDPEPSLRQAKPLKADKGQEYRRAIRHQQV